MKRIIVIGCPGSGKSTFAKKLNKISGLPLYHLDMIWHKPDRTTVSREEFDSRLEEITSEDKWIIDGNYSRTLEIRFKRCDTVFLFDLPSEVCLEGARSRIGKKREDLPWIEEELDDEFKEWIINFQRDEMPCTYSLIRRFCDKNIMIFKSREEAEDYLEKLLYNGEKNDGEV